MDFSLVVALAGLAAGVVALGLVWDLRIRVARLHEAIDAATAAGQQLNADMTSAHEAAHFEIDAQRRDLESVQHDLEQTQRELRELRVAVEVIPAPPLPKGRPSGLEDLRQRLRAAHSEPDVGEDV